MHEKCTHEQQKKQFSVGGLLQVNKNSQRSKNLSKEKKKKKTGTLCTMIYMQESSFCLYKKDHGILILMLSNSLDGKLRFSELYAV